MVQRLFPWLLVAAALGLIVVLGRRSGGVTEALSGDDMASLAYKVGLMVLIGGAVLTLVRQNLARALTAAVYWVVIALVLVLGYTYRYEVYDVADRVMIELVPGRAASR